MAYHIKNDGTPGICYAQQGNCPLGGAGEHFDTFDQAQEYSEIKNANKFGLFASVKAKYDVGTDESITDEVRYIDTLELEGLENDIAERTDVINSAIASHRDVQDLNGYESAYTKAGSRNYEAKRKLENAQKELMKTNEKIMDWAKDEDNPELENAVKAVLHTPTLDGKLAQMQAPGDWSAYTDTRTRVEQEFGYSGIMRSYTSEQVAVARSEEKFINEKSSYINAIDDNFGTSYVAEQGDPKVLHQNKVAVERELKAREQLTTKGMSDNYSEYEAKNIPENQVAVTSYGRIVNAYAIDTKGRVDKIVSVEATPIGNAFITENGFSIQDDTENISRIFIDNDIPGNMGSVSAKDNGEFK